MRRLNYVVAQKRQAYRGAQKLQTYLSSNHFEERYTWYCLWGIAILFLGCKEMATSTRILVLLSWWRPYMTNIVFLVGINRWRPWGSIRPCTTPRVHVICFGHVVSTQVQVATSGTCWVARAIMGELIPWWSLAEFGQWLGLVINTTQFALFKNGPGHLHLQVTVTNNHTQSHCHTATAHIVMWQEKNHTMSMTSITHHP